MSKVWITVTYAKKIAYIGTFLCYCPLSADANQVFMVTAGDFFRNDHPINTQGHGEYSLELCKSLKRELQSMPKSIKRRLCPHQLLPIFEYCSRCSANSPNGFHTHLRPTLFKRTNLLNPHTPHNHTYPIHIKPSHKKTQSTHSHDPPLIDPPDTHENALHKRRLDLMIPLPIHKQHAELTSHNLPHNDHDPQKRAPPPQVAHRAPQRRDIPSPLFIGPKTQQHKPYQCTQPIHDATTSTSKMTTDVTVQPSHSLSEPTKKMSKRNRSKNSSVDHSNTAPAVPDTSDTEDYLNMPDMMEDIEMLHRHQEPVAHQVQEEEVLAPPAEQAEQAAAAPNDPPGIPAAPHNHFNVDNINKITTYIGRTPAGETTPSRTDAETTFQPILPANIINLATRDVGNGHHAIIIQTSTHMAAINLPSAHLTYTKRCISRSFDEALRTYNIIIKHEHLRSLITNGSLSRLLDNDGDQHFLIQPATNNQQIATIKCISRKTFITLLKKDHIDSPPHKIHVIHALCRTDDEQIIKGVRYNHPISLLPHKVLSGRNLPEVRKIHRMISDWANSFNPRQRIIKVAITTNQRGKVTSAYVFLFNRKDIIVEERPGGFYITGIRHGCLPIALKIETADEESQRIASFYNN
ncbi:hypothetical protein PROFUN_11549 [Planoprotostelium fungivorum]|uniref:Uncharacterized protein n=1 Tax=Planoprotostelium fungivorum TaxID=1890364 RepID=A0A2P6N9H4_9EUKA|nr:hypothetical protein PROFUN_11549 [Planoprotostelium fungivorum]